MNKSFNKWCEKLLDTGKGNRLINFKESNSRTIQIFLPSGDFIFDKLSSGTSLSIFDYETLKKNKKVDVFDNGSQEEINMYVFKELTKMQIFAYKQSFSTFSILNNLKKLSNEYLVEKGINILFMAFGFLKWTDRNGEKLNSPLVLLPISIENKAKQQPFLVKMFDDEITTNPTLVYKLKYEMNIDLPEFRTDGNSLESLTEYFDRLQEIAKVNGWSLSNDVQIGIFSYLKLNMYKDLKENEDKVLNNTLIKRLLNQSDINLEKNASEIKTEETEYITKIQTDIDESTLENSIHNVVDCDSSQMMAIMQAKLGNSFVLQGPPGTGKSQTITNLIAEFLYDGKKVLFVSEKLAALKVVYNNLKKADLSDFCLELHSEKSNKKEFLEELHNMLSQDKKYIDSENVEYSTNTLKSSEKILDGYVNELHKKVDIIEKTPFELINEISKYRDTLKFDFIIDNIESKGKDFHNEAIVALKNYNRLSENIGYDYHENVWYGLISKNLSFEQKVCLKKQFENSVKFLKAFKDNANIVTEKMGIDTNSISSLNKNKEFLNCLLELNFFDQSLFSKESLNHILDLVKKINESNSKIEELQNKLFNVFSGKIFNEDVNKLYLKFLNKYNSILRIFNREYKIDKNLVLSYSNNKNLKYKDLLKYLEIAREIYNLNNIVKQYEIDIFDNLYQDIKYETLNWIDIQTELETLTGFSDKFTENLRNVNYEQFNEIKLHIKDLLIESNKLNDLNINDIQLNFDKNIVDFEKMSFENLLNSFDAYLDNYSELENYIRFYICLEEIKRLDLVKFIDEFLNQGMLRENLIDVFNALFYEQWFYYIVSHNDVFSSFSRQKQDMASENFIKADKEKFDISRAKIISQLSNSMPDLNMMSTGSQIVNIEREYHKKSRQKPIRLLLKEASELIQTLKPCFLMSPLSVSTYLEFGVCNFDVVIFDEASQIFPWDAIGAIARGKQVIVVGDSKQLSPTDFFSTNISSENDNEEENSENDDSLDFESILDLCSATFNQCRLNWHYRSKTEDLITFSNYNFYDSTLVTFPSAMKDNASMGISYEYVENGIFNRKTKTNLIEAEEVAKLVFEHFKTRPDMSLGVVAFSISQQRAIENLIAKKREENVEFEKFFENSIEPFFVKNLETVQGDERDVIIFSIGYAMGDDGKFIHNFGPLNKQGGERRLNVAVSRAKYNVIVVSSIKSKDIDLSKTASVGARMLKDYLDMAEIGVKSWSELKQLKNQSQKQPTSEIVNEISEILESKGYKIETNVGSSEFKIDICVKHPTRTDFVVAVECDGKNYRSGKTTRDRDRLRKEVLERLGFKFYRIWTLDWTINKNTEINKLIIFIEKAITDFDEKLIKQSKSINLIEKSANLTENDSNNTQKSYIFEEKFEKKDLKSQFKFYEEFDVKSKMPTTFDKVIFDLVKLEAPITEQLLMKKTAILFGREKVTTALKEIFEKNINRLSDKIFKIQDFYVVDKNMMIELRVPKENTIPRDIMMISDMELASGLYQIISSNFGITKKGLFLTITNLLGFSKIGANIQAKLDASLKLILDKNMVKLIDDQYFRA